MSEANFLDNMKEKIARIRVEASEAIDKAAASGELEQLRIKYLGRKGKLSEILSQLPEIPLAERPKIGKQANELKKEITFQVQSKLSALSARKQREDKKIDITLPGISAEIGRRHPITQVIDEISGIFVELGFRVVEGPEIDTEYYNFEVLNIPLEHPSRDVFDTFYIRDSVLLRSQTSNIQGRIMEKESPPLRVLAPGRVYRPDAVDATHSFVFHQIEGFMVDEAIRFSDLKGILDAFLRRIFGSRIKVRFGPHFFPFTEPSAEVDISCVICGQKGCRVCGGSGWLEILGSGMIDPAVFKKVGYDPEKYTGFAFGMGVERIAMLKYGINDIRLFYENDLRFLRQF